MYSQCKEPSVFSCYVCHGACREPLHCKKHLRPITAQIVLTCAKVNTEVEASGASDESCELNMHVLCCRPSSAARLDIIQHEVRLPHIITGPIPLHADPHLVQQP